MGHRGQRIVLTGSWSLAAKACQAANLLVCIPFVLEALGPALFGVWATLVSLVAFAGFLDFGLGNGTMNLVAAAHGRGDRNEIGSILREGRRILLLISSCLAVAFAIALPMIPWSHLLGVPAEMSGTVRVAVATVLLTILLAVPLNLTLRVQLGLGCGDRAFRWQALGQLLTLALVIALAKQDASLPVLVAAAVATPLLASIANTVSMARDAEFAGGSIRDRPDLARQIRREGSSFFVLQLAAALAFSADLPLISALRGPTDAGTYAITQRLFLIIPMSLGLIWAPLWPIYRQALVAGDHQWVKKTLSRSLILAVAFAAAGGIAIALGFRLLVSFWEHPPAAVGGWLLAGFAVWCMLEAAGTALAAFLNAASALRFQIVTACVFATICVSGKAWVLAHSGIDAVPWVTITSYTVATIIPFALFGRRVLTNVFARKY
jgi:O-antigen/teichoic acid export membrane protein